MTGYEGGSPPAREGRPVGDRGGGDSTGAFPPLGLIGEPSSPYPMMELCQQRVKSCGSPPALWRRSEAQIARRGGVV